VEILVSKNKKILGLVIARAGSKGVVNKNTRSFKGKPLIQWTLEAAKKSKLLSHVLVSTDSKKIINLSKKLKIDAPFVRPKKLSTEKAKINSVIFHAIDWLKKNRSEKFEYLILLQATSPYRTHNHIDSAIKYFFKFSISPSETLVSVSEAPIKTGWIMKQKGRHLKSVFKKNSSFRQLLPNFYIPNGAIYICNLKTFKGSFFTKKVISFVMKKEVSLDVDYLKDYK
jgi:CMP-N-acetylneuraminic acid synthetase